MQRLFVELLWVAIALLELDAVVTKDVPDYGLILGNPGKLSGYMSRHGHKLHFDENKQAICPESNYIVTKR